MVARKIQNAKQSPRLPRFLYNNLTIFTDKILTRLIRAYRKSYGSMFLCIPHDFLLTNLYAYGLSVDRITFLYSYLKRGKQVVKTNDAERKKLLYR